MSATIHTDGGPRRTFGPIRALTLVALLLCACGPEESPARTPPAASGEISCRTPVGEGADYSEFKWDCELPPGGYFQVAVYDYNGGDLLGPRRRSPRLNEPRWAPRSYDSNRFADEILWRVCAYDQARVLVARGEAIAKR